MKATVTLFLLAAYTMASNYCLAYSVITGEPHMPGTAVAESSATGDHPGCQGHSKSESSEKNTQSENGACCASFLCDSPVLLPTAHATISPSVTCEYLPVLGPDALSQKLNPIFYGRDHDPPGLVAKVVFLSPPTSRAPPTYL